MLSRKLDLIFFLLLYFVRTPKNMQQFEKARNMLKQILEMVYGKK